MLAFGEAVIAVEVDGEVAFTPVSEADDAGFAHEVQDVGADAVGLSTTPLLDGGQEWPDHERPRSFGLNVEVAGGGAAGVEQEPSLERAVEPGQAPALVLEVLHPTR